MVEKKNESVQNVQQREREAKTFIEKKGSKYVDSLASPEEKKYFEGTVYKNGLPDLVFISYMCSHSYL